MLVFALTTMEKLEKVPRQFWVNAAIAVLGFVLVVYVARRLRQVNIYALSVALGVVLTLAGFNWIYERNEPAFLTPIVDMIAPFFPSKGKQPGR